jgi:hypothetical protein
MNTKLRVSCCSSTFLLCTYDTAHGWEGRNSSPGSNTFPPNTTRSFAVTAVPLIWGRLGSGLSRKRPPLDIKQVEVSTVTPGSPYLFCAHYPAFT